MRAYNTRTTAYEQAMKERSRTLHGRSREEGSPGESPSRYKGPKVAPEPVGKQTVHTYGASLSAHTGRPDTAVMRETRCAEF
jgi:hypothetical protein